MRFLRRRRHVVLACLVLILLSLWPNIYSPKPIVIDVESDTLYINHRRRPRLSIEPAGNYGNAYYGSDEFEHSTNVPPCRKFFVVWPVGAEEWQETKTIALESLFRYDPCAQVFIYANELPLDFFDLFVEAGFFVRIERYDLPTLTENMRGSKYAEMYFDVRTRKRSSNYAMHEVSFLRAVLLYKYGGSYTSLDYLMLPTSRSISTSRNVVGAERCVEDSPGCFDIHYLPGLKTIGGVHHFPNNAHLTASARVLLDWDSRHTLMERILYEFDNYFDSSCADCTGDQLVGVLVPQFSDSVTLVAEELMFSVRMNQVNYQEWAAGTTYCDLAMSSGFGFKLDTQTRTQYNLEHEATLQCLTDRIRIRPNVTVPFDTVRTPIGAVLKQAYKPQNIQRSLSCASAKHIPMQRNVAVVLLMSNQEARDIRTILQTFMDSAYVREFVIWNNNPDVPITAQSVYTEYINLVKGSQGKHPNNMEKGPFVPCIRVYNVERGMSVLSLGRYAACLASTSALCYFQDGGYVVEDSEPLFNLANQEPHRMHSLTTAEGVRAANTWKFNDISEGVGLHAQFSGVNMGSCVSREIVQRFVLQLLASGISSTDRTMADFYFSVWANVPQDVLEGKISKLASASGDNIDEVYDQLQDRGSKWNQVKIKYSVDKLYAVLTESHYASVRHLFLPYDFSTPSWYHTISGEEQLRTHSLTHKHLHSRSALDLIDTQAHAPTALLREPSLFTGCTIHHKDYQGIVRTDASRYSKIHPPTYDPSVGLDAHLARTSFQDRAEYNIRNLVDGQRKTYFIPFMDQTCHNITIDLVQPIACSYVAVTLSSGAESVQIVVRMARSGRMLNIGRHRMDRRTGKQTVAGGRKGVMLEEDYSDGMRSEEYKVQSLLVSWVAVEVCARVVDSREVPIDVYDLSLVTEL
ncbi:hypothetical protein SARC_02572 [Sphaeroforma arctica JP610]|uniref:Alpha 1,4-glycosyltransferase domain-containing protein n=1 Tax=Sphaeroforma arctica JP610 TaxID=667725 RepID=A0A0L0G871_9EUKA|nr:hypothetical protein SARC_02572 [Sphaeroforma arctica JP610]KNC85237.1 hypothetical protein SARC_02572 [Sphaeroforma arctica JP610]|eukprot:XP_014159139.1 hypothetical protein SARC_02572 [Sphaeroforma arctica JP610]